MRRKGWVLELHRRTPEGVAASDWASRLAAAVVATFDGRAPSDSAQLHSVTAVSSDVLEIVYLDPVDASLRGIAIDFDSVRSARPRISESSVDELAFSLVYAGVCEPRAAAEFLPPDRNGVGWLPLPRWLEDVS